MTEFSDSKLNAYLEKCFWRLWMSHVSLLSQNVQKWLQNKHDSEDLVSIVMLKAYKSFSKQKINHFKSWLLKIARNLYIDSHLRNQQKLLQLAENIPENINSKQTLFTKSDLAHAYKKLSQADIKILQLFYYKNLSCASISQKLSITEENTRKRLQLSRKLFRRALTDNSCQQSSPYMSYEYAVFLKIKKYNCYKTVLSNIPPNRLSQKINTLREYCLKYPSGTKKKEQYAECLFLTGKWPEAILLFEELFGTSYSLHAALRLSEMLQNNSQKAIRYLKRLKSMQQSDALVAFISGKILTLQGNFQSAILYFDKALHLEPKNDLFRLTIIEILSENKNFPLAEQYNTIAKEKFSQLVCNLLALQHKICTDSVKAAQKTLDISPSFNPALEHLIRVNLSLNLTNVSKLSSKYLKNNSYDSYAINKLCELYFQANQKQKISKLLRSKNISVEITRSMHKKWLTNEKN